MSRRGWVLYVVTGAIVVLVGGIALWVGLDTADKIGGVVGTVCSVVGLGLAGYGFVKARSDEQVRAEKSEVYVHSEQHSTTNISTVFGDVNIGSGERRVRLLVWYAVAALLVVNVVLIVATFRSSAQPESSAGGQADPTTTQVTPSPTTQSSTVSLVRPDMVREVSVRVPDGKPASVDDIEIAVDTVGYTNTTNGSVDCGGGGTGPGGGSCGASAGDSRGSNTIGVVDFSVMTPALTCHASSVHVNESVVIDSGATWIRVVVLSIGPDPSANQTLVTFKVSRGHSRPAPKSPKVCTPS